MISPYYCIEKQYNVNLSFNAGADKANKKWVRIDNGAAVFRVELNSDEPFMFRDFNDLNQV